MKYNLKVLGVSVIFGLIEALIGIWIVYSEFGSWSRFSMGGDLVDSLKALVQGTGIQICEILLSMTFILAALFLMKLSSKGWEKRWLISSIGVLRIFLSFAFWHYYGKPGSSQIQMAILISFGALQGLALCSTRGNDE